MNIINNRRFFRIAVPIIFANVAVPIIGLVDTAVIGNLGSAILIAGAGMGAAFLTGIYHLFNFLTSGVSAITSQAIGRKDDNEVLNTGLLGLFLGLLIGLCLLIIYKPLFTFIFHISPAEEGVNELAMLYIGIRIVAAPFALANFALMGWLLAMERNFSVILIQASVTVVNIALDIFFVLYLDFGVSGVAAASAIAEFFGCFIALCFCRVLIVKYLQFDRSIIFNFKAWIKILRPNFDIFLRTLLLESVAISYIIIGSILGTVTQAANQILYQFISFSSYALDGFAFSTQVLVGLAFGRGNLSELRKASLMGLKWGIFGGMLLCLAFFAFGSVFIDLMTAAPDVRTETKKFLSLMAVVPIIGVASWILDGIFLGALETKKMVRAMLESVIFYFLFSVIMVPFLGNYGLWISMVGLLICRAFTLLIRYKVVERQLLK